MHGRRADAIGDGSASRKSGNTAHAALLQDHLTPTRLILLVVVSTAALNLTVRQVLNHFSADYTDLMVLYQSGQAWNAHGNPYITIVGQVNLNPPITALVLLGPWARLPWFSAQLVWLIAGLLIVAMVARWTVQALNLSWDRAVLGWSIALGTIGAQAVWQLGQLTWWLLPITTAGWWMYRTHRDVQAGLWLGVLVVFKPFFALMGPALGWRTCATAAATSLALALASVVVAGWEPWEIYQQVGPHGQVVPAGPPTLNASLWGIVGWSYPGRGWLALPVQVITLIGVVSVALLAMARVSDRDARWLLTGLVAILAAPLGWAYYLLLFIPACLALWSKGQWSWLCTLTIVAWWVPVDITYVWRWYYSAALLGTWLVVRFNCIK